LILITLALLSVSCGVLVVGVRTAALGVVTPLLAGVAAAAAAFGFRAGILLRLTRFAFAAFAAGAGFTFTRFTVAAATA
jgi:hypothetical protein